MLLQVSLILRDASKINFDWVAVRVAVLKCLLGKVGLLEIKFVFTVLNLVSCYVMVHQRSI